MVIQRYASHSSEGAESFSLYDYGLIDGLDGTGGAWLDHFLGSFVISSLSTTSPSGHDAQGLLRDEAVFGHLLDTDGRAPRVINAGFGDENGLYTQPWFWNLDGRVLELTARYDVLNSQFYSECDLDATSCMDWRVRRWLPLAVSGDRVYVPEWEEWSGTRDPANPEYYLGIAPRTHFSSIYRQDRDGDNLRDIDELFAGLDPADADSDDDGTDDGFDQFPLDPSESADTDGDGVGDKLDSNDDNDQMPDTYEISNGLDPLVDDTAADKDGDGLSNSRRVAAGIRSGRSR